MSMQVEVDYQGGGSYKRKYRVREIIPKGPFDITFKNEQVIVASTRFLTVAILVVASAGPILDSHPVHAVLQ